MRPGPRGGPASILIAGLALLAIVAVPAAGAPGRPEQAAGATTIQLVERTPWVGDGVDFVLSVVIDGAPPDADVRLTVHDRVRSRSEFARTLEGEGLRTTRYRSTDVPLADIPPRAADGAVTIAVPLVAREGVAAVSLPQAGVYPVVVEVLDADGVAATTLRTYLVRLPPFDPSSEAVPLDVVVVLPIHAPPVHVTPAPPPPPDVPLAEVAGALVAHPTVAVTAAPTPETIDAAAVTDTAATASLAATLADRQVLEAPWVVLDEAAWADADPDVLDRELGLGRRTLVDALGADPDGVRLVPPGSTSATVASMARTDATGLVLADDLTALDGSSFRFTVTRPFAVDVDGVDGDATLPALGSDAGLAAHAAAAGADPVLAASNLLADLAVLASDQPGLQRVAGVVLPEVAARSGAFLETLLGGLEPPAAPAPGTADPATGVTPEPIPAAAPVVVARTASQALAEVEPAGANGEPDPADPLVRTLPAEPAPASVATVARAVDRTQADVGSYGTVFGTADPLYDDLDLVVATSASSELTRAARGTALQSVQDAIGGQLAGLHGPESQRVTLTAREGHIQLLLVNDTGKPANVTLVLRGDRLVLPDVPDGRLPVALVEPQTRVDLRVEARSSGDAPLDVLLTTPDERIALGRSRITVRTTAVSGVGVVLLGTSAAFLVLWWTRTIVRERRQGRGRHPTHARGAHQAGDTPQT